MERQSVASIKLTLFLVVIISERKYRLKKIPYLFFLNLSDSFYSDWILLSFRPIKLRQLFSNLCAPKTFMGCLWEKYSDFNLWFGFQPVSSNISLCQKFGHEIEMCRLRLNESYKGRIVWNSLWKPYSLKRECLIALHWWFICTFIIVWIWAWFWTAFRQILALSKPHEL